MTSGRPEEVAANQSDVQRSFATQAGTFEDPTAHFGSPAVTAWLDAHTPTSRGDVVLEVAAGTGIFGRTIAPRVACVLAVDLTDEMLAEGQRAARQAGVANVVFQRGDATSLPFLDDSFDRVISRLAVHHFPDPAGPISEMRRVCRPGGTVTIVDMVVLEDGSQSLFNALERRRDPAHTSALTRTELRRAIEAHGLRVVHSATWQNALDADRWFSQTECPPADRAAVIEAWREELLGGPSTGMHPTFDGERWAFTHHWDLHVAELTGR